MYVSITFYFFTGHVHELLYFISKQATLFAKIMKKYKYTVES